ncbi:MAG TPA: hemerythrin domain-containing protein [Chitinophagaceae bacterium]|nr:hemerythrin domain-containing protein [Chitinophagaceae bacterium]
MIHKKYNMPSSTPIKRNEILQLISREHHYGLLLSWKIREGMKKNVEINRITDYVNWFWESHLMHHFLIEEKFVFSILPTENNLVIQAINEHENLRKLFNEPEKNVETLKLIEKNLDQHIRFEERVLFNEVQLVATNEQLELIALNHTHTFSDNWKDEFWATAK